MSKWRVIPHKDAPIQTIEAKHCFVMPCGTVVFHNGIWEDGPMRIAAVFPKTSQVTQVKS